MINTYLIFTIGNNEFAICTDDILTITQQSILTEVPMTLDFILGFINYNKSPIPLIDLNYKFNKTFTGIMDNTCNIILDIIPKMAIITDSVSDTIDIDDSQIKPSDVDYLKGLYIADDKNILIINTNTLN